MKRESITAKGKQVEQSQKKITRLAGSIYIATSFIYMSSAVLMYSTFLFKQYND